MKKSKAFIEKYLPSYQDAGRVNKPELPPIDPSKLSREQYEALYNQGRIATYDPASGAYQPPMMEGVTITADKPKSAADFFDRYNKKANTSADHLLEAMFTVPVDYITGLPQAAMSYMLDPEKSLTPSEALDITNPVAAFAVDVATDPADLVGAGLVGDALRIGKGIKKGSKAASEIKESTLHLGRFRGKKEKISKKLKTPEGRRRLQEYIDNNEHLQGLNRSVDEHIDDFEKTEWLTHEPVWDAQNQVWKTNPDGSLYEQPVDPNNGFNWYLQGYDKPSFITIGDNFTPYDAENVLEHEFAHLFQRGKEIKGVDDELAKISLRKEAASNANPPSKIEKGTSVTNKMYGAKDNRDAYFNYAKEYWLTGAGKGMEKAAFAAEVRGDLLQKGILKDRYDEITPEMLKEHFNQYQNTGGDKFHIRLYDIMEPEKQNFEYLSNTLNKMPALAPVTAAGYLLNESQTKEGMKKEGGSIQKLGYKRNSPHKNRRSININSNLITMDGVDIPLMLVPDNDEPMVAPPNSGQYMFPNSSSVQEIPMGKYRLGGMPCMECGGTVKYQKGGVINRENIKNMPPEMLKAVQRDLKNKGLYTGRIDGIYGPLTDRAITGYNKKSDPTISEKPTQSSSSTAKTNVKWPTQIESKPDDLIYTQTELEKYKDVYKARIEECSKGDAGCLERANRYYNKYVAPLLNLSSSWKELAADRPKGIGQSVDSWDIHGVLRERGGTEIKVPDELKKTIPLKSEYSTKKQEYPLKGKDDLLISMNIPVGSIIGFGTSAGTKKKYGKGTTLYNVEKGLAPTEHSARVVGYNEKGVPVIYDLDRIVPITEYRFPNKGIQLITAPKGAEEMTFEKLKSNPNFLKQPIKVDPKTTPLYKPKEKQKDIVQVEDPNKSKIEKAKDLVGSSIKNLTDSYGITNEEYADLTDEMVNFQKALSGYKQDFANVLNISNEEYDELAARAQALAMTETSGGRNSPRKGAYLLDKAVKNLSMGIRRGIKMGTSQGITQINEESLFTTPAVANKLRNLGITQSNWNPYDSRHVAAGTLALLKHNQNRAKKYKNSNKLDDLQLDSYYWNNPKSLFNGTAEGKSIHSKKYKQFYNQIKNPGQVSSVTSNEPNQSSPRSLKDGGRIESFKNKWLNR